MIRWFTDLVVWRGFPGERMSVLPAPLVASALARSVTSRLLVTDVGWFPDARGHRRERRAGAPGAIVLVCIHGAGWAEVDGSQSEIRPGGVVIIPAGARHVYGTAENHPWTIWWMHVQGGDVAELIAAIPGAPFVSLNRPELVARMMDEIVNALEGDQLRANLLTASGAAWNLLVQLGVDQLRAPAHDPAQRVMAYLAENPDTAHGVPALAALAGVSASHLGALFRRATGGGVLAYRDAQRMGRARILLDRSDSTVTEVAQSVGYSDALYFSRAFRRDHGVSPSEYRRIAKG